MINRYNLTTKASEYLQKLCHFKPNRRTGSPGNRAACDFFADAIRPFGFEVDTTPFDVPDYQADKPHLLYEGMPFEAYTSPYSPCCDVCAELVTASTVEQLENAECRGKILLMKDELCEEQLMPKNFVFYNPDSHKKLYALLEKKQPSAIITATAHKPEMVGALYPFPLIVDGDFGIPSVYCTDVVGGALAENTGGKCTLIVNSERIPSYAYNVLGRKTGKTPWKVIVCAHIDAYEDTPGASDNASGVVVQLLLAELLGNFTGAFNLEILALNGEDHYSAAGQMDYLRRYGSELETAQLVINIDDVGYTKGRISWSQYGVEGTVKQALASLHQSEALIDGEPWFNGDHMIFVQKGIPALAFTSEMLPELMATITHTEKDTPDIVEPAKLVTLAEALSGVLECL